LSYFRPQQAEPAGSRTIHPVAPSTYLLSQNPGQVSVNPDAIHNLAAIWGADAADILGLAMAHEIGHLLLRTGRRSTAGMMEPRYLQKELASAERGSLVFTQKESNSIVIAQT